MLKAVLPLVVLFAVILLVGTLNSAFASPSHPFITQWGQAGIEASGAFGNPQNAAIDSDDNVYVTDLGNNRVQKFNNDGTFLTAWGSSGSGAGQFNSPSGITVDENYVYVVDSQLNKIQKFDKDGNFITQWGVQGDLPGEFLLPNGITMGENSTVYVVDTGNHRVQQFTSEGEFLKEFGESGILEDQFISPMGITIDGLGNIYVSDSGSTSIKKFTKEGVFIKNLNSNVGGFPLRAQGIASDPEGNLYVADTGNNRILRLDPTGTAISVWGNIGIQPNEFLLPKDVVLDSNANLFVVDSNNNRIQKFATPIIVEIVEPEPEDPPTESEVILQPVNPIPGDLTKPVITPPNDLIIEATGVLTSISVGQALATDESGIQSLTHNAPDEFTLGTNTVIWTAIDGSGNMAIATQTVAISDTIPPVISTLSDILLEAENPTQNIVDLEIPTATDTVGVVSIESDAPEFFPIGDIIVTWTATDIVGNQATSTQKVSIIDTTSPTLYVPADIILEASSFDQNDVYLGESTVIDKGEIISITNDSPQLFGLGNTTVTWFVADAAGNTESRQQLVTILDSTSPEIIVPNDIISEAISTDSNIIDLGELTVNDIQDTTVTNDASDVFALGQTIVTWTATDSSGNSASATQLVTIVDTTIPTLIVPQDITSEATGITGNIVSLGEVTVEDISGIIAISNDSPESFDIGTTIVTWVVQDNYGNIAVAEQSVSVVDTTSPTIIAPAGIEIEAVDINENFVDLGQTTVDDLVEIESIQNDSPASFPIGMTTITWTVSDTSGNTATDTQIITIVDTTQPEIIAPEDIIAEATGPTGMAISLGESSASDIIGVDSITNDAPEIFLIGETVVIWTATDLHGNSASATQTVSVIDSTSPTITVPDNIIIEATTLTLNVVEIGMADATDAVGVASIENNMPEFFEVGETEVTWTATDAAGNTVTAAQLIKVVDTTPPTITPPESIVSEATSADSNILELTAATADDAVGVVSITHNAPDVFPVGDTIITWTATDSVGNSATASQLVSIIDTTTPSLYAPNAMTVEATNQFENIVDYGSATANDAVGVTSISSDAPNVFPLGLTSITWTAQDAAGNEYSAIQQIFVVDNTEPSLTIPPDVTVEAESIDSNLVDLGVAEANDSVFLESLTNDAPSVFQLGETIVTWTTTDSSGNSASATQLVTIVDTTAPSIVASNDIIAEANSLANNVILLVAPTTEDSVSSVTVTNDAPTEFVLGDTIVTWTATDDYGNSASDSQLITVIDTTNPTIVTPSDITIEASSQLENIVDIGIATANDLVGIASITNDAPASFPYGETVVTWTTIDTSSNSISDTQLVTVIDTTSPAITSPQDVVVEATGIDGNIVDIGTATASDILDVTSLTNDAPASFLLGDTIITWTAIDQDGNSASTTQTITVIDTTPPVLTVPENVIVDATSLDNLVSVGQATSTDLIDSSSVITNDSPETFPLGETIVTWSSVDMFGNAVNSTQIVEVQACGQPISYYNMIMGTPDDDIITGTNQPDLIFALGGDDIVTSDKGNDCVFGGEGDDILFGNEGNDYLVGDEGNDIIKGQSGNDVLVGGTGLDVIDGGDDQDTCIIENSNDDLVVKCEL